MRVSFASGRLFFLACTAFVLTVVGCGSGNGESGFVDEDAGLEGGATTEDDSGGFGQTFQACVPKTCAELGFECGPQGDGCGNLISCGDCPKGSFCGGGGPSKCGIGVAPDGGLCHPKTCADLGAKCGQQGDGCGHTIDCG